MEFRTKVETGRAPFQIEPHEPLLFVGSCFAAEVGRRFRQEQFPAVVNPFGTMYNPASVLHTLERWPPSSPPRCDEEPPSSPPLGGATSHEGDSNKRVAPPGGGEEGGFPRVVFLTLGTNHVYIEKATGRIVDNCQKRPAALFEERELTVDECAGYLRRAVGLLRRRRPDVQVVMTVSPIRYRKYGYHRSQLSKATLLLAIERVNSEQLIVNSEELAAAEVGNGSDDGRAAANSSLFTINYSLNYFPSYELLLDELRDYRFYAPDMLHPSAQAVDYVWERLVDWCFSESARQWLDDWRPVRQVLAHRPLQPDSEEYRALMDKTMLKVAELRRKYPTFAFRNPEQADDDNELI